MKFIVIVNPLVGYLLEEEDGVVVELNDAGGLLVKGLAVHLVAYNEINNAGGLFVESLAVNKVASNTVVHRSTYQQEIKVDTHKFAIWISIFIGYLKMV